jgi:hypothetical protein
MIRKSGNRFSEKIMPKQRDEIWIRSIGSMSPAELMILNEIGGPRFRVPIFLLEALAHRNGLAYVQRSRVSTR